MRHLIVAAGLCLMFSGCGAGTGAPRDAGAVYEAVLKVELKDAKQAAGSYVFVDGKDPSPELLQRFQKQWPELRPGSKAVRGKATSVSVGELKWLDDNTAELRGGFSDGRNGRGSRYRVVRKDGAWVVEKAVVEVQS
jgi:hypothetical protein